MKLEIPVSPFRMAEMIAQKICEMVKLYVVKFSLGGK